jgi:hypothetical protein
VQDGVAKIDVSCTGKTKAGGAAALAGTTSEPGLSMNRLPIEAARPAVGAGDATDLDKAMHLWTNSD